MFKFHIYAFVVTGLLRSGNFTLLKMFRNSLLSDGVLPEKKQLYDIFHFFSTAEPINTDSIKSKHLGVLYESLECFPPET